MKNQFTMCVKRNKQNLFYLTNNLAFKISLICLSLLVLNMLNIFWIEIVIWTLKAKQLVWVGWIFLKRFLFWSCYPHNTIWHTTLQRYTKARKTKLMELDKSKKNLHTCNRSIGLCKRISVEAFNCFPVFQTSVWFEIKWTSEDDVVLFL